MINYEEGAEHSVLNGDTKTEVFLAEGVGGTPQQHVRSVITESIYDYGARAGIWRLLRAFERHGVRGTVYGVGLALQQNPAVATRCREMGWEIACHGWRWIDYADFPPEREREELERCVQLFEHQTGRAPAGWYVGRLSRTSYMLLRELYAERGDRLLWLSDSYADDLPFWREVPAGAKKEGEPALLILPYSLDCNDYKYMMPNNWSSPEDFEKYLKDAFDSLYEEGVHGAPKMMSIGLHARISGRPGRVGAVKRFVEYVMSKPDVWVATVSCASAV